MFDKSKVGQSFPPFTIEVERGKIRELALAIGDDNPIYQSREEAQAAGYPDVPLYPTSPTTFTFWGNRKMISQIASLGINLMRVLHGEEEYEYLAPIYPGDTLTGVMTLVDGSVASVCKIDGALVGWPAFGSWRAASSMPCMIARPAIGQSELT